jgi:excisionase family DNA binding protein
MADPKATSPLFVRIPSTEAEKLERAAFELKRPKQELVAEALRALELPKEGLGFGQYAFRRNDASDVLTTAQLARLLQVDEDTVRTLAKRGELPGRKVGRHWRFSRQAILDWLASGER